MNMLAMKQGDTLLYTLPQGGWFAWPDGAMGSPAVAGVTYNDYYLAAFEPEAPTIEEIRALMPTLNPGQIRLALLSVGITEEMVDAKLANDPAGLIEWKHRPSYRRLHPLVLALAAPEAFDLPPEQIDALWLWAVEL